MASIAISASLQRACSTHRITRTPQRETSSLGIKQVTNAVTLDVEGERGFDLAQQQVQPPLHIDKSKETEDKSKHSSTEHSAPKFVDERWKNGTWDLNMFVKNGRMDWDGVIVAEARRRKFLEIYPEAVIEPVLFRSSIIPWWAWLFRSYLPEAELLNGRAAMIGFFMAYAVDALTGLDVVGQTGNFICKAGLFVTVIGVVLLRRTQDLENLRKLVDEATHYDKQWQASWEDQNKSSAGSSEKLTKKI